MVKILTWKGFLQLQMLPDQQPKSIKEVTKNYNT